jgi:hypothetical protein
MTIPIYMPTQFSKAELKRGLRAIFWVADEIVWLLVVLETDFEHRQESEVNTNKSEDKWRFAPLYYQNIKEVKTRENERKNRHQGKWLSRQAVSKRKLRYSCILISKVHS